MSVAAEGALATDERYMRRCLQLAANGRENAKPNPMVGAVLVAQGRIIGEGYHVRCGEGHAEVNCFASVRPEDEALLGQSTLYVSLEPCSHYGRTPPCADLIVRKGVRRVVVGCIDPFAKVQGRGIEKLREAGIDVTVGVLEDECMELNRRFVTVNTHHRPYVVLKWAQTLNGIIGHADGTPLRISSPFTQMLVHKLRAECDAILVGRKTLETDHPRLDVRLWSGRNPERLLLCGHDVAVPEGFTRMPDVGALMSYLQEQHRQCLLVEGGAETLRSFISADLYDEIRVETALFVVPAGVAAPALPASVRVVRREQYDGRVIITYRR